MTPFNIIDYISSLTSYVFDKPVLERIALKRGASNVQLFEELEQSQEDLMLADLLYTIYVSPNSSASYSVADGSFKTAIGSQTINDKSGIYDIIIGIYDKYDDPKLDLLPSAVGSTAWINENE